MHASSVISVMPDSLRTMDYSPPGSSVHGIFQARIQDWVAISFSRGSFWPWNWIPISSVSCIAGSFFTHCATYILIYHICRWYQPNDWKRRGTKEPLNEKSEIVEWKSWLETQHSKNEDHNLCPLTSWQIEKVKVEEVVTHCIFLAAAMKLKHVFSLEGKLWEA